jgi:hypothetical protein
MAARRVFISYSREDRTVLQELLNQMKASRYDANPLEAWHDLDRQDGIEAGEDWMARLKAEIEACEVFCIFLTANWGQSNNCQDELLWAEERQKRIVQIQVRDTAIPRPKESRVPNGAAWIGADTTEGSRGRRDELWRDVVEEIQRIGGRAQVMKDLSGNGAAAGGTGAVPVKDFGALCEVIEALHAYKRFHDAAHDLYDKHYKSIQAEVSLGCVDTRTRAECRTAIELAKADIHTTFKERGALLADDAERIDVLLRGLDEFRTALGAAAKLDDPDALDQFMLKLLDFGSLLSRSLSYFNRRMIATSKSFDPKRFMDSLQGVLDAQEKLRDELVRWVELADSTNGLLAEHTALQANQDSLMNCEPDELANARKRKEFLEGWPKIAKQMNPLLKLWTDIPADDRLDEDTREKRQLLPPRFSAVHESVQASVEPLDPETLKSLKRNYGDFWDTFDKYFLGVDRALKAEYERVEMEMGRMT